MHDGSFGLLKDLKEIKVSPLIRMGILMLALLLYSGGLLYAQDDAKITILVVNPSDRDSLKSPVVYYLPTEIKPEHVIENAGMEILYDQDKNSYYLSREIELAPKETKKIAVVVKNVWTIAPEEIEKTKELLQEKISSLAGTKYEGTRQLLFDRVSEKLDAIENAQKQVRELGIRRQIDLFRANVKQLEEISRDIISLEALRRLEEETESEFPAIRFVVSAENPSSEPKEMTVHSYLPPEVKADDIVNKLDFDLTYNQDKQQFALEKIDSFEGHQTKKYTFTIRNIWHIPETEIQFLKQQTEQILEIFRGNSFEAYAEQNGDYIFQMLDAISALQGEVSDSLLIEDHKRAYALNSQRLVLAKKKIRELQDLMLEGPLQDMSKKAGGNKLEEWASKLAQLRDLLLRKMGYRPDRATTWLLIFGICAFLAIFAVIFYLVWIRKMGKEKFKKPKGAFGESTTTDEKVAA